MPRDPLVLVPGLLCDDAVWRPVRGALDAHAEVTIASHGEADHLGRMAEQLLERAPARFALAGHSMGGRIALEVVARAPERVTRLALLDTGYEALAPGAAGERERAGRYRLLELARREGMRAMAAEWVKGMVHPARLADTALVGSILDMFARATPDRFDAQIRALLARPDRGDLLPRITVPCLVLCGREDAWSPPERHRTIARAVPGSALVEVPDCGHMAPLEQPAAVAQAMLAWLQDPSNVIPKES